MAISTEVTFDTVILDTTSELRLEITSDFFLGVLTWAPSLTKGLITLSDNLGNVLYDNTDTLLPDISSAIVTPSSVNFTTNTITSLSQTGYALGSPATAEGSNITGIVSGTTYYAIPNADGLSFQLATTRDNAVNGVIHSLVSSTVGTLTFNTISGRVRLPVTEHNSLKQGTYTVSVSLFQNTTTTPIYKRSQKVNVIYLSPIPVLEVDYSTVAGTNAYPAFQGTASSKSGIYAETSIFLAAQDKTSYTLSNYVLQEFSRDITLYYPNNNGFLSESTKDYIITSGFYGGNPAVHDIKVKSSLYYKIPGASQYTDEDPLIFIPAYLFELFYINTTADVYSDSKGCEIYSCLYSMYSKLLKAIGTDSYDNILDEFNRANALGKLIVQAYDCKKNVDVNDLMTQFKIITNCSCDSCYADGEVVPIGTTPNIQRTGTYTTTVSGFIYQNDALKGLSFINADFAISMNGIFRSGILLNTGSGANDTLTFDSISGTLTSSATINSGTKIAWWILRP